MSKWDAARGKGKYQDQSDEDRSLGARRSWRQSEVENEKSDQEGRVEYGKHFLTPWFKSLEDVGKNEETSTRTSRMESASARRKPYRGGHDQKDPIKQG